MASSSTYGRRKPQIKKQNLYMMTALWMEQSPWAMKPTEQRVVGAVFVRPNDRVLSVDCSRSNDGGSVHGAIRALIKYPDVVEGCQVYLSRQPCAHCVKMLVQARVTKVFYLPLKPEKKQKEENKRVDALFKVSPVSREVYVPHITEAELKELHTYIEEGKNIYGFHTLERDEVAIISEWADDWKDQISEALCWEEYSDDEIKDQVDNDMQAFLEWFRKGVLETGTGKEIEWQDSEQVSTEHENFLDVANHLSRLAQMLSYRTDDPNTGVGCVITSDDEIVSIGWNGFPSKALYGNHPRGSREDAPPSKYSHVIYALENALLSRNRRGIEGSIVYHSYRMAPENTFMLKQLGAKMLIMPSGSSSSSSEERGKLKVVAL